MGDSDGDGGGGDCGGMVMMSGWLVVWVVMIVVALASFMST